MQISDLRYKGDANYTAHVVQKINALAPEFVCFTGDLIGDKSFAPAALDFIRQIEPPVYGCPGNWDYGSGADFREYEKAFRAAEGAWLEDAASSSCGKTSS